MFINYINCFISIYYYLNCFVSKQDINYLSTSQFGSISKNFNLILKTNTQT